MLNIDNKMGWASIYVIFSLSNLVTLCAGVALMLSELQTSNMSNDILSTLKFAACHFTELSYY
jgi:hypothetical protein